ncbi:unnamed protein product, partial [Polarella glacialis]
MGIPKGGQAVPISPPSTGFDRLGDREEADRRLFQDCCSVKELAAAEPVKKLDSLDDDDMPWLRGPRIAETEPPRPSSKMEAARAEKAQKVLGQIDPESLTGKVAVPIADQASYFGHFSSLCLLDFIQELMQTRKDLEKAPTLSERRGKLARGLACEPSEFDKDNKIIIMKLPQKSHSLDFSPGQTVALTDNSRHPLAGGVVGLATVVFCPSVADESLGGGGGGKGQGKGQQGGGAVIVELESAEASQLCNKHKLLRLDAAPNFTSYRRQMESLKRLASRRQQDRWPLWDLLPMGGVGGDNVDSWAAKMRTSLDNKQSDSFQSGSAKQAIDSKQKRLQELAAEPPQMEEFAAQEVEQMTRFLRESSESLPESPGLAKLNASQRQAIADALNQKLTVIQGPPGTGKTHVSTQLIRTWVDLGIRPILVTSHNNVAVDNIAESAKKCGINVVRVGRTERISETLETCSISNMAADLVQAQPWRFEKQPSEKGKVGLAKKQILKSADVVCVTTIASASGVLKDTTFEAILMDEAAQATEPSTLVPIAHCKAKRLVLVGDHCQLPANTSSLEAETRGLTLSLFGRLVAQGLPASFLDTQFRMHPAIAEHSSAAFYGGKLKSGVSAEARPPPLGFPWPKPRLGGVAMLNTGGQGVESKEGDSWCNEAEMAVVVKTLESILKAGDLLASQVGVVTPYSGQVKRLRRSIRSELSTNIIGFGRELEIASVDSFQGREKELIIFSAVRSNNDGRVGFLADWRRLNVLVTRARRGLIVVGDVETLKHDPAWGDWINW